MAQAWRRHSASITSCRMAGLLTPRYRDMAVHNYLWACPMYASVVNVGAHRGMPAHRYLWAFPMYASVVNVVAHRGMPVHRYLWALPMYASVVNVDAHMGHACASLFVGVSDVRKRGLR